MEDLMLKYILYYNKAKELNQLGRALGFKNGQLPCIFTEGLCRELVGLKEIKGKEFDATNDLDEKIEIKATIGDGKSTTISSAKFDYLYWINIKFDSNEVIIKKYEYKDIEKYIEDKKNRKKKDKDKYEKKNKHRINIKLDKIKNCKNEKKYIIEDNCIKEVN